MSAIVTVAVAAAPTTTVPLEVHGQDAALVSEQTSRTLFALTLVTVRALPSNLVAAWFGMNVGGVPLAGSRGRIASEGLITDVPITLGAPV